MKHRIRKSLKELRSFIDEWASSGTPEPGQVETARKAIDDLGHGLEAGDLKQVQSGISRLARVLLRESR